MKNLFFIMLFTCSCLIGVSQNFFETNMDQKIHYIILTNPTVSNIETIRFLTDRHIFPINRKKVQFVGIYHRNQAYNFRQSMDYLQKNNLTWFHLQEVSGELTDSEVFKENGCSGEFRLIFEHSIGIFFFGGPDIQPELYGEKNSRSVVTDPVRHAFEVSLLFHLLGGSANPAFRPFLEDKPDYLVTGFCLGLQTMNVATGGTLVQDIPAEIYGKDSPREAVKIDRNNLHRNYWQEFKDDKQLMGINFHEISFTRHPFFGKTIRVPKNFHPLVYSSHHQSVEKIGAGFEVTVLSPDKKIIEGLAHKKFPNVFGVQFHPEVPALYENREKWKFTPEEVPRTFHNLIGHRSVAFHKKYWRHISDALRASLKSEIK